MVLFEMCVKVPMKIKKKPLPIVVASEIALQISRVGFSRPECITLAHSSPEELH